MKTVTQKVFGFLYKTCLANPGGIPSPDNHTESLCGGYTDRRFDDSNF